MITPCQEKALVDSITTFDTKDYPGGDCAREATHEFRDHMLCERCYFQAKQLEIVGALDQPTSAQRLAMLILGIRRTGLN